MKNRLKQDILEAEREVEELEDILWYYSRDPDFEYELSEEGAESELLTAQNHLRYLLACWESDYGTDPFGDEDV